jgi:hypothetical protein
MFSWLKHRQMWAKLAEEDATTLMARFGDCAYHEARKRSEDADSGTILDGNRPAGHRNQVRWIISKKTGRDGLDTATRYLLKNP